MAMKHNICRRSVCFSIFLVVMLFGGIGVHAEEKQCVDVSGTWASTEEIGGSDCGMPNQTRSYIYELIQHGCVVNIKGKADKAVVKGDRIYWPSRSFPGRLTGSTVILEAGVSLVSGNKATGKRSFSWTDGTKSCSGMIVWTDIKQPRKDTDSALAARVMGSIRTARRCAMASIRSQKP
jgi:hypothetical protein